MREMSKESDKTLGEQILPWFQMVAFSLAGIWAFYHFVLGDLQKPVHINPDIDIAFSNDEGLIENDVGALKLDVSIKNASSKPLFVIMALLHFHGSKMDSTPVQIQEFEFDPDIDDQQKLLMKDFEWEAESWVMGHAILLPKYELQPGEATQHDFPLFFSIDNRPDTIVASLFVYAAERCQGVFPFQQCFEYSALVGGSGTEVCEGIEDMEEDGICSTLFRRKDENSDWEIADDQARVYEASSFAIVPTYRSGGSTKE